MRRLLIVLLVVAFPAVMQAADPVAVRINSTTMGEPRTILIRTPPSYANGERPYPVLYLTDGETQLLHTAATADFLGRNGRMPEVIVVGITNTDRTRDLTPTHLDNGADLSFPTSGGADKFLQFISAEVIPYVEANYRTQPFRVFAGHSFGGLFAMHVMMTQPHLFNAVIAASPSLWWDGGLVNRRMADFLKANRELESTFVFAIGNEGAELDREFAKLKSQLEKRAPKGFVWLGVKLADEDHGSVVLPAHFTGLKKVFEPWRFTIAAADDPLLLYPRARDHFAKLSRRVGYTMTVPEATANLIGYRLLQKGHQKESIEVFRANAEAYPLSANVYDSLAEAYERAGQLPEARDNYDRAASIGEKNRDPNTQIFMRNRDRVSKALSGE